MKVRWWKLGLILLGTVILSGCLFQPENNPPVPALTIDLEQGYAPLTVSFDASGSYDPDGDRLSFVWDFGDGTTGSGTVVKHTFSSPGEYTITLRVVDPRGGEASASAEVNVLPVPEGKILRRYHWDYDGEPQYLEFLIPESLYLRYHNQVRHPLIDNYNYGDYVIEPVDDPTLSDLADALQARATGGRIGVLDYILAFVQGSIRYVEDQPGMEYPLYPIETLVDGKGDCEDTTILYVSLVRALGHPDSESHVTMAFVDTDADGTPDHVLGLVPITQAELDDLPGTTGVWTIDGTLYAVAETAVNPELSGYIRLGTDPWGIGPDAIKQRWDY